MNFLYWNLNGKNLQTVIESTAKERSIDVIIVSEFEETFVDRMVRNDIAHWHYVNSDGVCDKVGLIYREKMGVSVRLIRESVRFAIYLLVTPTGRYTLVGLHLQDRRNYPDPYQRMKAIRNIKELIINDEELADLPQIFIGDFNAGPTDPEMTNHDSMFAIMYKGVAKRVRKSTSGGEEYHSYYNPILMSISEDGEQYGSIYHSGFNTQYWYSYDQIVVTHELIDTIRNVQYLKGTKNRSFVSNKGIPLKEYSDHLPLYAELDI